MDQFSGGTGRQTAPLQTQRLILTPLAEADLPEVAAQIFGDPEVVKTLAHDGSHPAQAMVHATEWWSWVGADAPVWAEGGIGLYAIRLRGTGRFAGCLGCAMERRELDGGAGWWGELFYALARPFHGAGIASEAAAAVLAACDALPEPVTLYATYWPVLNPGSARVLEKAGFELAGRIPVLSEFDAARFAMIRRFDLWRLSRAPLARIGEVLRETGIRLGQLSLEDQTPADAVLEAMLAVLPTAFKESPDQIAATAIARGAIAVGRSHPAMARVIRRPRLG